MSELNYLINSRKFQRKKVTEVFNDKDNFVNKTLTERITLKRQLDEFRGSLKDLDHNIYSQKFLSVSDDSLIEDELEKCNEYKDKIINCSAILDSLESNVSTNIPYSNSNLLKSPTAPLPKF